MTACVAQHGRNWLCKEICATFLVLHQQTLKALRDGTERPLASLHSFEVWHEGKLEAGEVLEGQQLEINTLVPAWICHRGMLHQSDGVYKDESLGQSAVYCDTSNP